MADISQPEPKGVGIIVLPYVMNDIRKRAEKGKEKYGVYLHTDNGRDALWDAYQEALDLVFYLRQEILQRDRKYRTYHDVYEFYKGDDEG